MYHFDLFDVMKELSEKDIVSVQLLQSPDINKWKKHVNEENIPFFIENEFEAHRRVKSDKFDELASEINYIFKPTVLLPQYLPEPIVFNDMWIYCLRRHGWKIPQQEQEKFRFCSIFLVLEGVGEVIIHDNVKNRVKSKISAEPGSMVIIRGPGFGNNETIPWYYGSCTSDTMTLIALRHNSTK